MNTEILIQIGLSCANVYYALILITIGLFSRQSAVFVRILYVLLFSLVLNKFLKQLWHIPLPSHIGQGFAFPSGHMQSAVVFWGALAVEYRKTAFYLLVAVILSLVGFALYSKGYHTGFDILGAVVVGALLLAIYYGIQYTVNPAMRTWFGFILCGISLLLLHFIHGEYPYLWGAIGLMIGLTFGLRLKSS